MRRSFFHLTIMHTPSLYDYTFPYLVHTYLLLDSPLLLTYDCLQLPSVYICITFEKCHVKKSLVCIAFNFFVCIIHFLTPMNAKIKFLYECIACYQACQNGSRQESFVWFLFYSNLAKLKISCIALFRTSCSCIALFRTSCYMVGKAILFTVSPSYVVNHKRVIAV